MRQPWYFSSYTQSAQSNGLASVGAIGVTAGARTPRVILPDKGNAPGQSRGAPEGAGDQRGEPLARFLQSPDVCGTVPIGTPAINVLIGVCRSPDVRLRGSAMAP